MLSDHRQDAEPLVRDPRCTLPARNFELAPVTVTYGSLETPEFQRQNREFASALRAAGKSVQLIAAPNYTSVSLLLVRTAPL